MSYNNSNQNQKRRQDYNNNYDSQNRNSTGYKQHFNNDRQGNYRDNRNYDNNQNKNRQDSRNYNNNNNNNNNYNINNQNQRNQYNQNQNNNYNRNQQQNHKQIYFNNQYIKQKQQQEYKNNYNRQFRKKKPFEIKIEQQSQKVEELLKDIENEEMYQKRNDLQVNDEKRYIINKQVESLPINSYKKIIIETIKNNQVTVIAGDTGCGKSTQVPKFILQDYNENQIYYQKRVKIICTQPRRIAAISLAHRVGTELKEEILGQKVGYHIKTDNCFNNFHTQILFVTTGMFLTRLIHQKSDLLEDFTHIIMDEIHERDLDSDFSLIALKHYLAFNKNIKIILMSATINHHKFADYFSVQEIEKLRNEILQNHQDLIDYESNKLAKQQQKSKEKLQQTQIEQENNNQENINISQDDKKKKEIEEKEREEKEKEKNLDKLEDFMDTYVRIKADVLQSYYWNRRQKMDQFRQSQGLKQDDGKDKMEIEKESNLQQGQEQQNQETQKKKNIEKENQEENKKQKENKNEKEKDQTGGVDKDKENQEEKKFDWEVDHDYMNTIWQQAEQTEVLYKKDDQQEFQNKAEEVYENVVILNIVSNFKIKTVYLNNIFISDKDISKVKQEQEYRSQQEIKQEDEQNQINRQKNKDFNEYIDNPEFLALSRILQDDMDSQSLITDYWNNRKEAEVLQGAYDLSIQIIKQILFNNFGQHYKIKQNSSILIFLPGMREIQKMSEYIEQEINNQNKVYKIIELHGSMSDQSNSQLVMQNTSSRKIIIATNIAESSITIPDCGFVIDFCLTKHLICDTNSGIEKLTMQWASQASLRQRTGRVGRVSNGMSIKLIPYHFYEYLQSFPTPEILRCPLEKLILRAKRLDDVDNIDLIQQKFNLEGNVKMEEPKLDIEEVQNNNYKQQKLISYKGRLFTLKELRVFRDPVQILGKALNPPPKDDIGVTIKTLLQIGGLEEGYETIYTKKLTSLNLTNLGIYFCDMPTDIRLSKFISLSVFFQCFQEAVTIAAILGSRQQFFRVNTYKKERESNSRDFRQLLDTIFKYDKGCNSDIILRLRIYMEWENNFWKKYQDQFQPNLKAGKTWQYKAERLLKKLNSEVEANKIINEMINKQILQDFVRLNTNIVSYGKSKNILYDYQEEFLWCQEQNISPRDMREILSNKIDLIKRHQSNVSGVQNQNYKKNDIYDDAIVEKIQHCFTTSFLQFTMSSDNDFEQEKQSNIIENIRLEGLDPRCTILIDLKQMFVNLRDQNQDEIEYCKECVKEVFNHYALQSGIEDIPLEIQNYENQKQQRINEIQILNQEKNQIQAKGSELQQQLISIDNDIYRLQNQRYVDHNEIDYLKKIYRKKKEEENIQLSKFSKIERQIEEQNIQFKEFQNENEKEINEIKQKLLKIRVNKIKFNNSNQFLIEFKEFNKETVCFIKKIISQKNIYQYLWNKKAPSQYDENYLKYQDEMQQLENKYIYFRNIFFLDQFIQDPFFLLILTSPCDLIYPYRKTTKGLDESKRKKILIDRFSVNHYVFNYNFIPRYLVSFGMQEKDNNKYSTSVTFGLSKTNPQLLPILGLIFGCTVNIQCDENGKHYDLIEFDGVQTYLKYYLFDEDIENINKYRNQIKEYLDKAKFLQANGLEQEDTWQKIFNDLIDKPRIRHIKQDKWLNIYSQSSNVRNNTVEQLMSGNNNQVQEKKSKKAQFKLKNRRIEQNSLVQFKSVKKGFMQQLEKIASFQNQVDCNSIEQQESIKVFFEAYNKWKIRVLQEVDNFKLKQIVDKAFIICGKCYEENQTITPLAQFNDNLNKKLYVQTVNNKYGQQEKIKAFGLNPKYDELNYSIDDLNSLEYAISKFMRVLKCNAFKAENQIQILESVELEAVQQNPEQESIIKQISEKDPILAEELGAKIMLSEKHIDNNQDKQQDQINNNQPKTQYSVLFTCKKNKQHQIGVTPYSKDIHPWYKECYVTTATKLKIVYPLLEREDIQDIIFKKLSQLQKSHKEKEYKTIVKFEQRNKVIEQEPCLICLDDKGMPKKFENEEIKKEHLLSKDNQIKEQHIKNTELFKKSLKEPMIVYSQDSQEPF